MLAAPALALGEPPARPALRTGVVNAVFNMIPYRGRLQACAAYLIFVNETRAWEAEQYNASLATARIAAYKNGADQGRRDCDVRVLRVMGVNQVLEGRLRDTTRERDGYKEQLKQSQVENARLVHVWQEEPAPG
jgi:hypothetical protein